MIDRRKFIKSSGALAAFSLVPFSGKPAGFPKSKGQDFPNLLPNPLKRGDTIGLITPASPITQTQLDKTIKNLKQLGFKPYYLDSVMDQYGYYAGTEQQRVDELMHMFSNNNVDAVLSVRGGYGAVRILDKLDYDVIRLNRKPFIGYSDITAFLNAIHYKTGLITFHGPLGISDYNKFTWEVFYNVLMNPQKKYTYPYQREPDTEGITDYDLYTINKGKAKGQLIGGNISVLETMIGTEFEPDFSDKIVLLEEVEEKTYKVDKMLYHLLNATNLKKAAGIAFGSFNDCNKNDEPRLTLKEALNDLCIPLDMPVTYGFPFGHNKLNITLPIGIKAKLDSNKNRLTLLEPAVRT